MAPWSFILLVVVVLVALVRSSAAAGVQSYCQSLDPSPALEKFVDALPIPASINVSTGSWIRIGAYKIRQKMHRDLPPTTVYAFGTSRRTASSPGPTLHATKHVEARIRWSNYIWDAEHMLTVDRTVHWARPSRGGVPIVPHLHGGETESRYDGHPDAWFTAVGDRGLAYHTRHYRYLNQQRATTLWYHDHAVGITRLNVLAGLVGFYLIHDNPGEEPVPGLPSGPFHIPLLFQDKTFWSNGSINFPSVGDSPAIHPNWCPEYYGDVMLLNGKAWPFLHVLPTRYRFRILNAANARFLDLSFSDPRIVFFQIGTDGGYLDYPRNLSRISIAPAERVDVIVDFSQLAEDDVLYLNNSAPAPFPSGDPSFSPEGTNVLLKIVVVEGHSTAVAGVDARKIVMPETLFTADEAQLHSLDVVRNRSLVLQEVDDKAGGPIYSLLANRRWTDPVTETPRVGSTEVWDIVNLTPDAHPIHIHLVRFKVLNWQSIDTDGYVNGTCDLRSDYPSPTSCYTGTPQPPLVSQQGWKDTAVTYPGNVTRFLIRFTSQNGRGFPFDPTTKPGYVWHCHILDHEDNDMMRPLQLTN